MKVMRFHELMPSSNHQAAHVDWNAAEPSCIAPVKLHLRHQTVFYQEFASPQDADALPNEPLPDGLFTSNILWRTQGIHMQHSAEQYLLFITASWQIIAQAMADVS